MTTKDPEVMLVLTYQELRLALLTLEEKKWPSDAPTRKATALGLIHKIREYVDLADDYKKSVQEPEDKELH